MKQIIVFASGSGSNAEQIIIQGQKTNSFQVVALFCNNPEALVLAKAKNLGVKTLVFDKEHFQNDSFIDLIKSFEPDLLVLAGFLWKIPKYMVDEYPNQIINIHPALLPFYGGKGMYGMHIHKAVFENQETESGITIHYVNEHYDEGDFIFQKSVNIEDCESPEEIAQKVLKLEHVHFPQVIQELLS